MRNEFESFIIDNHIVGFSEELHVLASGRTSHLFIDWSKASQDVYLMDEVTNYILAFAKSKGLHPDCFYGVAEGTSPIGLITQFKWGKMNQARHGTYVLAMGRGKLKERGPVSDRKYVGAPRGKTIVIEDTVTTGLSLLPTLDQLLAEPEVEVMAALCLFNRMALRDDGDSVAVAAAKKGIPFLDMADAFSVLPRAYACLQPRDEIADAVEAEYEQYGIEPLKLRR